MGSSDKKHSSSSGQGSGTSGDFEQQTEISQYLDGCLDNLTAPGASNANGSGSNLNLNFLSMMNGTSGTASTSLTSDNEKVVAICTYILFNNKFRY